MMASPFPGMDPYLEDQGYWKELHLKFVNGIQDALALDSRTLGEA
jgi:Protein of unknown function (DUF4058)